MIGLVCTMKLQSHGPIRLSCYPRSFRLRATAVEKRYLLDTTTVVAGSVMATLVGQSPLSGIWSSWRLTLSFKALITGYAMDIQRTSRSSIHLSGALL